MMNQLKRRRNWVIGMLIGYAALVLAFNTAQRAGASQASNAAGAIGPAAFTEPTYSSPIALSADKNQLWVVNPDSDTVSVFNVSSANPASYQLLALSRSATSRRASRSIRSARLATMHMSPTPPAAASR